MAMSKQLRTELSSLSWKGGRSVVLRQRIIEGPEALLDRSVVLHLSFDDIERLVEYKSTAEARIVKTEVQVAEINARNRE